MDLASSAALLPSLMSLFAEFSRSLFRNLRSPLLYHPSQFYDVLRARLTEWTRPFQPCAMQSGRNEVHARLLALGMPIGNETQALKLMHDM
jgi:hypothetical protein